MEIGHPGHNDLPGLIFISFLLRDTRDTIVFWFGWVCERNWEYNFFPFLKRLLLELHSRLAPSVVFARSHLKDDLLFCNIDSGPHHPII